MCTYDFTKCSLSCSFNAGGGSGWSQEEKTWKKPHLWINHHLEIQQFLSFDFITSNSFPVYHNLSFRGRELLKVQPRKRSVSPPHHCKNPRLLNLTLHPLPEHIGWSDHSVTQKFPLSPNTPCYQILWIPWTSKPQVSQPVPGVRPERWEQRRPLCQG